MRKVRYMLWGAVGVVAAVLGFFALSPQPAATPPMALTERASIGGPFTLTDAAGDEVTREDLLGKPHAIFFGYTYCPDICPTTLGDMTVMLRKLDAEGVAPDAIRPVFISVDAERDTPELLRSYMEAFDPRILALTGSRERIDEAVKAYKVDYEINEKDEFGDVLIDHTASVLLFGADGELRGTIAHLENPDVALAKLRNLAGATNPALPTG